MEDERDPLSSFDANEAAGSAQATGPLDPMTDVPDLTADSGVPKSSIEARRAAGELSRSVGRRGSIPVRKVFVRRLDDADRPPLVQLYAGGRSGTVAVKLYLALIWRSAGKPHHTEIPARAWATLLDLPDPVGKGARRVSAALRALERHSLVTVEQRPGHAPRVTLLDESGDRTPYTLPSTAYTRAKASPRPQAEVDRHRYFKVSERLWLTGDIQAMSGPALVMLLILLAERGGEGHSVWFSTEAFHERYRISHQTRATGTSELITSGLLTIDRASVARSPGASTFAPVRMRNIYTLNGAARA